MSHFLAEPFFFLIIKVAHSVIILKTGVGRENFPIANLKRHSFVSCEATAKRIQGEPTKGIHRTELVQ